jgi:hypothetical protein
LRATPEPHFTTTHLGLYSVMDRTDLVAMSADPAVRADRAIELTA